MLSDTATYTMQRVTLIAPRVQNDGRPSNYPAQLRTRLLAEATNWTEHDTAGWWLGTREPGVMFEFYVSPDRVRDFVRSLAAIARSVMVDQDAIQLTVDQSITTLYEV